MLILSVFSGRDSYLHRNKRRGESGAPGRDGYKDNAVFGCRR